MWFRNSSRVLASILTTCTTSVLLLLCAFQSSLSFSNDYSSEIVPKKLIESKSNYSIITSNGYLLVKDDNVLISTIYIYNKYGKKESSFEVAGNVISLKERHNRIYILIRKRNGGVFYLDGNYFLLNCNKIGNCQVEIEFNSGVFDFDFKDQKIFFVEFDQNEVDYKIESLPVFSRVSKISEYSIVDFSFIKVELFDGITALDIDNDGNIFIQLLYSGGRGYDKLGVYKYPSLIQVDGYRPLAKVNVEKEKDFYYQPRCFDFLYDAEDGILACVIPYWHALKSRMLYEVIRISSDGVLDAPVISYFYPYRTPNGQMIVVNERGRIISVNDR